MRTNIKKELKDSKTYRKIITKRKVPETSFLVDIGALKTSEHS